jgi:L-lactate permease
LANPTKLEAAYDRFDAWWCRLPIVRASGRLQAFPFIHVFVVLYAVSGILIGKTVEWVAADWERGAQTALFAISWMMFAFVGLITLMVRSAIRDAKRIDDARKSGSDRE